MHPETSHILVPLLSDPNQRVVVSAKLLAEGVFLIHYDNETDADWQFKQRSLVKCRLEIVDGETVMVAERQVLP